MVMTKLQRSFNSNELHQALALSLSKHEECHDVLNVLEDDTKSRLSRIKRPPLPLGSSTFEQTKGEMEIEMQSQKNGKETLPNHTVISDGYRPRSGRGCLLVPAPSPTHLAGHKHRPSSGRRSPSPFNLTNGDGSPARKSPYLDIPANNSRPSSGRKSPFLGVPASSKTTPGRISPSRSLSGRRTPK